MRHSLKRTPSAIIKPRFHTAWTRSGQAVTLTEEGRAFYQRFTPILAAIDEAERAVAELHGEPRGSLKVNASTAFGYYHIEPLIPGSLARLPDLRLEHTLSESIINLIEEEVDVAVRISQLPERLLIARKLGTARRIVVASPVYLEWHGTPQTLEDLKDDNCLRLSKATSMNQWEFKGPGKLRRIDVAGNFEANSGIALHRAAVAGIRLLWVGNITVAADVRTGQLVPVLADHEPPSETNIYADSPHETWSPQKKRGYWPLGDLCRDSKFLHSFCEKIYECANLRCQVPVVCEHGIDRCPRRYQREVFEQRDKVAVFQFITNHPNWHHDNATRGSSGSA